MNNELINRLIRQAQILDTVAAEQREKGNLQIAYIAEARASVLRQRTGVFAR